MASNNQTTVWTSRKEDWKDVFENVEITEDIKSQLESASKEYSKQQEEEEDDRLKAFDTPLQNETLASFVK